MSTIELPQQPFYPPTPIPGPPWEALVRDGRLCRADVVLTHGRIGLNPFSWISWFIRLFTRSYWNHVSLVYVIRNITLGYDNTFVIESEGQGIDIHNISKYLANTKNDIAIKRLEAPWFTNPSEQPEGGVWFQRQVRGFALDEIDASYDWGRLFFIGLKILGQLLLHILLFPLRLLLALGRLLVPLPTPRRAWRGAGDTVRRGRQAMRHSGRRLKRAIQDSFICSGFVQYAYYYAIHRAAPHDLEKLAAARFNPELDQVDPADTAQWDDTLRATTPADLGRTRHLRWRYVVKDGQLWEVGVPDHIVQQQHLTLDQVLEMEERQVEAILKGRVVPQGGH